jgi:hypothetical protein
VGSKFTQAVTAWDRENRVVLFGVTSGIRHRRSLSGLGMSQ